MTKKEITYKFYNFCEKILMIPPILIGLYMINKSMDNIFINIDFKQLDIFYNILTKNIINVISLIAAFLGALFIGNINRKIRILGSIFLMLNNFYLIEQAIKYNPEIIFLLQMSIYSYLNIKTIINETKNLKKKEEEFEHKIFSYFKKIKTFLIFILKKGIKNLKENFFIVISIIVSIIFYILIIYNITFSQLYLILNTILDKMPETIAISTALLGINEISKGNLFAAGNFFLISNITWFMKPNTELHHLITILYIYTATLTAKNGLKLLKLKEKELLKEIEYENHNIFLINSNSFKI